MTLPIPILVNKLRKLRIRLPQLHQATVVDQHELASAIHATVRDLYQLSTSKFLNLDGPEFIHSFQHLQVMEQELTASTLQLSILADWRRVSECLHIVLEEILKHK